MRDHLKFALPLIAGLLLGAPARAQAVDPATLDVAGVRLGMTGDQAIAALKANDPHADVIDMRQGQFDGLSLKQAPWPATFNAAGTSIWNSHYGVIALSPDFRAWLDVMRDSQGKKQQCFAPGTADSMKCANEVDKRLNDQVFTVIQELRATVAWFAPVQGQDKVIAVSTNVGFVHGVPTVADTLAALKQRYPMPASKEQKTDGGGEIVWWKYDPRNRLMSQHDAERKGLPLAGTSNEQLVPPLGAPNDLLPYIALPRQIDGAENIGMMAIVDGGAEMVGGHRRTQDESGATRNQLLSPGAHVVLFDSHALGLYQAQALAYEKAQREGRDKSQIPPGGGFKPKF